MSEQQTNGDQSGSRPTDEEEDLFFVFLGDPVIKTGYRP